MSGNVDGILTAQMRETKRLELETLAGSFKAQAKMIFDDNLPILTRNQAIKVVEEVICNAVISAADNDLEVMLYPHLVDYLKILISIAGMPISEETTYSLLQHINTVRLAFDRADIRARVDLAAPFATEICTMAIQALIKFRNKLRIVGICYKILVFESSSEECREIFLSSGLMPILANMITTYSKFDRERFVIRALAFLKDILESCWPDVLPISVVEETAFFVFQCILNSTSEDIVILGNSVIWQLLRTAGKETIGLKFINGKTGLDYVLLVVEHTLDISKYADEMASGYMLMVESTILLLYSVVNKNLEPGENTDKVLNGLSNTLQIDTKRVFAFESRVHMEMLEAVRALLVSVDVGDVEGTNVVDRTLADHADVHVQT